MSKYGMRRVSYVGDRVIERSVPKPAPPVRVLGPAPAPVVEHDPIADKIAALLGRVYRANEALAAKSTNEPAPAAETHEENKE